MLILGPASYQFPFLPLSQEKYLNTIEANITVAIMGCPVNGPQEASRADIGIAGGKNFAALYLRKYMLNKGAVFTLKLMEIFNRHHVSYEHMPSGIDDLTVIFKKDALSDQLIDVICNEIQTSLNPDQMQWIDDYAITMVVGEGMKDKLTLCASIFYPLGKKDISIQMINQGASQKASSASRT